MKVLSRVIRLRRAILRYGVDTGKPDVRLRGVNGRRKKKESVLGGRSVLGFLVVPIPKTSLP